MVKINFIHEVFLLKRNACMKLNYFKRKEERNVYKHFVRSYEIEKEDLSV